MGTFLQPSQKKGKKNGLFFIFDNFFILFWGSNVDELIYGGGGLLRLMFVMKTLSDYLPNSTEYLCKKKLMYFMVLLNDFQRLIGFSGQLATNTEEKFGFYHPSW